MFNKTRRPLAVIVSVLMAVAIVFGTLASLVSTTDKAFAAASELISASFPKEVLYGDSFTVKKGAGDVTVRCPDGTYLGTSDPNVRESISSDTVVTANQIGNYVITYYADSLATNEYASYTYNVLCYMEYDYKIVIDNNGADIPSVWKNGDTVPVIPSATLYYYDEDEERYFPTGLKDDPLGQNVITCTVTAPDSAAATKNFGDPIYDAGAVKNGTYFIDYAATILGGKNVFTKQFTVQVQSSFIDEKAPTINISGIASTSSVNVRNTLPVSTTSDDYDERVKTTITVKHDFGSGLEDVPEVVVDLYTGYAKKDDNGKVLYYKKDANGNYIYGADGYETTTVLSEAKKAVFDNESFMSFYPTESGVYKVTYVAEDDKGNKSSEHSYNITVSDTTGPVIDKIAEEKIPSKWGEEVSRKDLDDDDGDGDSEEKVILDDVNIYFPLPEIFDNADSGEDITCSFTVTDSSSRQIIYVANILGTTESESTKVVVRAEGAPENYYFMNGNVSGSNKNIAVDGVNLKDFMFASDYIGSYSVKYVAKDKSGNTSSLTKEISFRSSFEDNIRPTVRFDVPDYFAFRSYKTIESINEVSASDDNSASLDVDYTISFDGETYYLDYKAGYTDFILQIKGGNKHIKFEDKDGKKIEKDITADTIIANLTATDDVGNIATTGDRVISLIDSSVADWNVEPVVATTYVLNAENKIETDAQGYVNYGGFTIDFENNANRNYTGFEIYVQQVARDGSILNRAPLSNVEFDYYSDNGSAAGSNHKIYVKNIKFKVSLSGKYLVVIKGFNVSGKSCLKTEIVDIKVQSGSEYGKITAAISSSIELGKTYELNSDYFGPDDATVLRHIKGGRMSIMGTEFTPLQDCGYTFEDYIITYGALATDPFGAYVAKAGAYSSAASVNESPEFQVLGVLPTYVTKNSTVVLPAVSASTSIANASVITCKVVDKDGNLVTVSDNSKDATLAPNQFSFKATKDGVYTVTYSASVNDKESSISYEINCGDITPPEFTVEIGSINGSLKLASAGSPDATVGNTFNYAKIIYNDEDTTGYTCSKTLISPEGEEVAESKVTTPDSANNGSAYELTIAGTYTVVYTVTDAVGNTTTVKYYINVTNSSTNVSSEAIQTLTIVLIIVGVIIIAGVIIYLVRFRKRKA